MVHGSNPSSLPDLSDGLRSIQEQAALFREVDSSNQPFFLLRYGEIGLKSRPVRQRFLRSLENNLLRRFQAEGLSPVVNREQGRLYLFVDHIPKGAGILQTTPGIVSFSLCFAVDSEMDTMLDAFAQLSRLRLEEGDSFAVRARRSGNHPFTSQELAISAGERVLQVNKEKNISVNLTKPDKPLYVEVRNKRAFFYLGVLQGVGGFPVGVGGNIAAFPGSGLSPRASLLMMKRGCRVFPLLLGEGGQVPAEELKALEERLDSYHIGVRVTTFQETGEKFLSFVRNKKIEGLAFDMDFAEVDTLLLQDEGDVKQRFLENAGIRDEEALEHLVKMPFFFPNLADQK